MQRIRRLLEPGSLSLGDNETPSFHQSIETFDTSRLVATGSDSDSNLNIEDAIALYAAAGVPHTPRSIQRYTRKTTSLLAKYRNRIW